MDDVAHAWQNGPTGGVAAAVASTGLAVLLVAWRAIPVYREWGAAILDFRGKLAEQGARLAGLSHSTDSRIEALAAEVARLRADLDAARPAATDDSRDASL